MRSSDRFAWVLSLAPILLQAELQGPCRCFVGFVQMSIRGELEGETTAFRQEIERQMHFPNK
jgi:hypothetical protein